MGRITTEQSRQIMATLEQNIDFDALELQNRIIRDSRGAGARFATFLKGDEKLCVVSDVFRLIVDYNMTLEQMIVAGRYDWKNDDITAKRFPIKGEGTVEFEARYFHFNREISSESAVMGIEAEDPTNPWAPAQIEHLLAHGVTSPEEQSKYAIIALGSVAEILSLSYVSSLRRHVSDRDLHLNWFDDAWSPFCRFLAARKVSVS